jgi:hypothetical protein
MLKKPELLILLGGLVTQIVIIIIFSRFPLYDEPYYLHNVALLHEYGLSIAYLMHHEGSAGPLYSVLHYLLEPITHLRTPYIRLVNISLMIGTIYFLGRTLKLLHFSGSYALCVLAIPMTYIISGLALTEIPAMFFFSAGIYLIIKISSNHTPYSAAIIYSLAGGIFMSFAILGRQPYLLTLAALPILFWNKKNYLRSGFLLILTIVASLGLPCYIFYLWNGLVAPPDSNVYEGLAMEGVLYRPEFFLLCLAYFSIIFIIIAPGLFVLPNRRERRLLLLLFIFLLAVNYHFEVIRFLPIRAVIIKIIPAKYIQTTEVLCGTGLVLLGMYFITTLLRQLHKKAYPKELVFYSFASLLIAISCMKITWGFSSRYAAQAIPMLIPIGAYFFKRNNTSVYRIMAGVILGLISFASYVIA